MVSNFLVALLLSYISVASFSAAIITPALPQIQSHFALTTGAVEWVVSAFLLGYVIGQLLYGPIANRWGRVFALRVGLTINLIGVLICSSALVINSFGLLILGRLISALGSASGLACTFMLINEWLHESQRKTAMAYSILSFTFGVGIAVIIGGIITSYWGWPVCFFVLLLQSILMLWGTTCFPETLKKSQPINFKAIITAYVGVLKNKSLILFALVAGSCSVVSYCFSAAGPQIAHDLLKLTPLQYSSWNMINMVGMLIGGLSAKFIINRFKPIHVIYSGFVGCGLANLSLEFMLLFHSSSALWFFLTTASLYLFSSLSFTGGSYLALNEVTDKGNGSSMTTFINLLSAVLAVIVMGYLNHNPMYAFVMILIVSWTLVVILLLLRLILTRAGIRTL